jgi:Na+-driven multidrug efflux pump
VYGLDIVNLFRQHKEKIVIKVLLIGACLNAVLSSSFLYLGYGLNGALLGASISQLVIMLLFLKKKKND